MGKLLTSPGTGGVSRASCQWEKVLRHLRIPGFTWLKDTLALGKVMVCKGNLDRLRPWFHAHGGSNSALLSPWAVFSEFSFRGNLSSKIIS